MKLAVTHQSRRLPNFIAIGQIYTDTITRRIHIRFTEGQYNYRCSKRNANISMIFTTVARCRCLLQCRVRLARHTFHTIWVAGETWTASTQSNIKSSPGDCDIYPSQTHSLKTHAVVWIIWNLLRAGLGFIPLAEPTSFAVGSGEPGLTSAFVPINEVNTSSAIPAGVTVAFVCLCEGKKERKEDIFIFLINTLKYSVWQKIFFKVPYIRHNTSIFSKLMTNEGPWSS